LALHISYLAHMLVICVRFIALHLLVTKMAQTEAPCTFPNYSQWPTTWQTDEHLHLKARSKKVVVSVFAC